MLIQLSNSFLVASRLDAWDVRPDPMQVAVPEHLRDDLGLTAAGLEVQSGHTPFRDPRRPIRPTKRP